MEGDDPLVHSMENLIVDKKPTEYEDPAIVRFVTKPNPIYARKLESKYLFQSAKNLTKTPTTWILCISTRIE